MKRKSFLRHTKKSKHSKDHSGSLSGQKSSLRPVVKEVRTVIAGIGTPELRRQIKETDSFDKFWEKYKEHIVDLPLSEYLNRLRKEKKLKRSEVVVRTGLDRGYVYEIFAGKKKPSRDKLITIAFGMKLSEEETQEMLRLSGHRELWTKDERDDLLLFAIQRGMSLEEVHAELERYGLDPLAAPVK